MTTDAFLREGLARNIPGKRPRAAACPTPVIRLLRALLARLLIIFPLAAAAQPPQLSFEIAPQGLRLNVAGNPDTSYRVESSTDLTHWSVLATTYPSSGTWPAETNFVFTDREFLFGGQKFYRAIAADSSSPPPTNPPPDIIVSDPLLTLYEGASESFSVRLGKPPISAVTIHVSRTGGSTNISVSAGSTLTFDPSNWSIPQTVTVSAAR